MHLSAEEALDLIDKKAPQEQVEFWNAHILTCSSCDTQLKAWQGIRELLKRAHLESAPELLIRSANSVFEPPAARRRFAKSSLLYCLIALLNPRWLGHEELRRPDSFCLSAEGFDVHLRVWSVGTNVVSPVKSSRVTRTRMSVVRNSICCTRETHGHRGGQPFRRVRVF